LLTASVNLLIGSASAKWALLAPIFVPMLMQLGLSPELTQAAYRVGDSTTNIVTPLMPYFPLVVAFSQRYVKKTGIGTLTALMLPYSITFLVVVDVVPARLLGRRDAARHRRRLQLPLSHGGVSREVRLSIWSCTAAWALRTRAMRRLTSARASSVVAAASSPASRLTSAPLACTSAR
jgi:hypothetical protein